MNNNFFSKLIEYSQTDYYPFHMPGHKRSLEPPYSYDITEIEGFDNLHNPQGIILDIMKKATRFYGSKQTYLLVNGSTCGILGAISAATKTGDEILVARNCHKSVYNGVFLKNLEAKYIYPETIKELGISGEIKPKDVGKQIIENPNIKAVIITSPTYEGVVSDIKSIAEILHKNNIPLIVDEAHGAHLGMHPEFLPSALSQGADIVIQSVHKTLPSLTQTAILHFNSNLISKAKLAEYLAIYQSSSPSYVLMASIERCVNLLIENGPSIFNEYVDMLKNFRKQANTFKYIKVFEADNSDISKLVISVRDTDYSGERLYNELLEKYHLQLEMKSEDYVIGMTSFCDSQEGFERLYKALFEIDKKINQEIKEEKSINKTPKAIVFCSSNEAFDLEKEVISLKNATGRISGEYKFMYPPGIPIIVPGEIITEEIVRMFDKTENISVIKGDA